MKDITKRLRVLRSEHDITQRDLALRAGMPLGRYWEIENGYRVPNDADLRAIAGALRVDPLEIAPELAEATR